MPTKIITKNGSGTPATSTLDVGELAVDLTNKKLYSSTNGTDVVEIGFNGQFDDGTAAAPSITFADDNDTGFYRTTAVTNAFSVAAAGTRTATWGYGGGTANLIVGNDTPVNAIPSSGQSAIRLGVASGLAGGIEIWSTSTGAVNAIWLGNSNGIVGSVVTNGSTTTYNTTSDYRLKDNVADITNAIDLVKQLPTKQFTFKADPSTVWHGFIAHELGAVYPNAVTGEKDAVIEVGDFVNPNGKVVGKNARKRPNDKVPNGVDFVPSATIPEYQCVDHSKLVPLLVKAVQELTARIEALESV